MTPEEFNRAMEFIVESQARLAAAQEQDRRDRVKFEEWSKDLFRQMAQTDMRLVQLIDHQSQRMDRMDKFYDDWLQRNEDFQRQALRLLNLILDRLPPGSPNPN